MNLDIISRELKSIAVSIHVIASALSYIEPPKSTVTPFPWDRMCVRTRRAIRRAWQDREIYGIEKYNLPLSCEDVMEIGKECFSEIPKIGWVSLREIENKLTELGFENWK